jgi:hypothetical protein
VISLAKLDELIADFGIAPAHVSAVAFVILMLSGFSAPRCEATVYDSDGSEASVRALHNIAHDGDTITLPPGVFSWTTSVSITKGITLKGQTNITGAGTANTVIDDRTIILDNVVPRGQNQFIVKATMSSSNQSFRLTGVTFTFDTQTTVSASRGAVQFFANVQNKQMRMDHCHLDQLRITRGLGVFGWCLGVADHNMLKRRTDIGGTEAFLIGHDKWNNDPEGFGNASWADYPWYGTDKFFFIEDNTIEFGTATDTTNGSRWVLRHNYILNCNTGDHGTEGLFARGQRCKEIYNNEFHWTITHGGAVGTRSGTCLVHDNLSTGTNSTNPYIAAFSTYRETYAKGSPFGIADGTCIWDANDTEGNGTFVEGHPPFLFDSGTASSTSAEGTLTDATKSWTTNQWVGFSIKKPGSPFPYACAVKSNTATTITYFVIAVSPTNKLIFNAGDPYQIHRCVMAVDQAGGGGKTDLLAGSPIINTTTGTASYAHPTIEPSYSWNNVQGTSTVLNFNPLSLFNGCAKLGVHFFNLGNGFTSTPQAVIDKYTTTLNGAQYTGTFTYPHPLVSGAPTPTSSATPRSHQHLQKKKAKKLKKKKSRGKIGE